MAFVKLPARSDATMCVWSGRSAGCTSRELDTVREIIGDLVKMTRAEALAIADRRSMEWVQSRPGSDEPYISTAPLSTAPLSAAALSAAALLPSGAASAGDASEYGTRGQTAAARVVEIEEAAY